MMRVVVLALALMCMSTAAWAQTVASLLEGRFDNELQVFFEADQGVASPGRAQTHWSIRRQDDGAFVMHRAPDALAAATSTHVLRLDGDLMLVARANGAPVDCVVAWRRVGASFVGQPQGADCAPVFPGLLTLAADGIDIERPDGRPADRFRRARPFVCWVAVLRGARHGDQGAGAKDNDWFFTRNVWLHDQGGLAAIMTDETPKREIRLRLRRVAWPSGPNRPSLTLYVLEPGNARAVSYAWGEHDANRLGINLRWMQASCTHEPGRLWP